MTFIEAVNQPPKAAATPEPELRHLTYNELDILHALRGFCAFYVVIFHAKYILWAGGRQYMTVHPRASWNPLDYFAFALDMLSSAGFEMVIFFFVLSGFFIRYAQLKKHRAPLAFYLNRIVRIYPPYLVSVLLAAGLLLLVALYVPTALQAGSERELNNSLAQAWQELRQFHPLDALRVLGFLKLKDFYIGYNDVYWSLLPEALFYLFVPLAFWRIRAYYVVSVLGYVAGIVLKRYNVSLDPVTGYWLGFNLYFAVGAALYDAVIRTQWLSYFRRMPAWLVLGVAGALFLALLPLAVLQAKTLSGIVATMLAVWGVSGLLAGKVSRQNPLVRGLHSLGVFSFSLYLYHFPLLLLSYGLLVSFTGELVFYARYYWLAVPLVTLVCYALYWVTERASVNYFRKV
jgi:peptidoglycan/LPS O-acetylase OafA/YrhL